jgi:hypothetical protein
LELKHCAKSAIFQIITQTKTFYYPTEVCSKVTFPLRRNVALRAVHTAAAAVVVADDAVLSTSDSETLDKSSHNVLVVGIAI